MLRTTPWSASVVPRPQRTLEITRKVQAMRRAPDKAGRASAPERAPPLESSLAARIDPVVRLELVSAGYSCTSTLPARSTTSARSSGQSLRQKNERGVETPAPFRIPPEGPTTIRPVVGSYRDWCHGQTQATILIDLTFRQIGAQMPAAPRDGAALAVDVKHRPDLRFLGLIPVRALQRLRQVPLASGDFSYVAGRVDRKCVDSRGGGRATRHW